MDTDKVLSRYNYYQSAIVQLSRYPLDRTPGLGEIGMNKSMIQSAYKDIKQQGIGGDVIDWLCTISSFRAIHRASEIVRAGSIISKLVWEKGKDADRNRIGELYQTVRNPFDMLRLALLENWTDGVNFLRLIFRNPKLVFDNSEFKEMNSHIANKTTAEMEIVYLYVCASLWHWVINHPGEDHANIDTSVADDIIRKSKEGLKAYQKEVTQKKRKE
jgi:hypothetical protein